jgi:hypothetical protein
MAMKTLSAPGPKGRIAGNPPPREYSNPVALPDGEGGRHCANLGWLARHGKNEWLI